jgi:hypothetical protein
LVFAFARVTLHGIIIIIVIMLIIVNASLQIPLIRPFGAPSPAGRRDIITPAIEHHNP